MPVTEIPLSLIPGVKVSIDGSAAVTGLSNQTHRVLVIGTKLAAGSQAVETPIQITRVDEADALFGAGSMLAAMCRTFRSFNTRIELTAIALAEDAAGVKATKTITIVGTATAAGSLVFLVGGVRVAAAVAVGDTPTVMAASVAAAINLVLRNPTTATSALGVVTATVRWKGATGNDVPILFGYYGDKAPAGVTSVTIADGVAGETDPDVADAIAVMGPKQFHTVIMPYTDTANLNAMKTELELRWGPTATNEGISVFGFRGNYGDSQTFGNALNSKTEFAVGTGLSPTPPWVWAANLAAVDSNISDPAEPRTGTLLRGVLPPLPTARFSETEQELLLLDGVSTYTVSDAGDVAIQTAVTTYQVNDLNIADTAFRFLETVRCCSYYRQDMLVALGVRFAKHKVADDDTPLGAGQRVATPALVRGFVIGRYAQYMSAAICEDGATFEETLVVERHPDDPGRIDLITRPNWVNQLRNIAERATFLL